jgi:hypothetical protein
VIATRRARLPWRANARQGGLMECASCGKPAPQQDEQGEVLDDTDWVDMGWHFASDGRLLCPDCRP